MALVAETWHWNEESFILAWEAGVFRNERVELVEGEVWPVSSGEWHGAVTNNIVRALPNGDWRITAASLPASGSVLDPDVWVRPRDAQPVARLGNTGRLLRWNPADVVLVVEVADSSLPADLEIKARVYGRAGFPTYWVVHRGGVEMFTEPYEAGYRSQDSFGPEGLLSVPYGDHSIEVGSILDAED